MRRAIVSFRARQHRDRPRGWWSRLHLGDAWQGARDYSIGGNSNRARGGPQYVCANCGAQHSKWSGMCSRCEAWNTLQQALPMGVGTRSRRGRETMTLAKYDPDKPHGQTWIMPMASEPLQLSQIESTGVEGRIKVPDPELSRVLGGGLVQGSMILLAGSPGVGKSTLALQLAMGLGNVLYVAAEESAPQVKQRADRIHGDTKGVTILSESNLEAFLSYMEKQKDKFDAVIVDSIQTVASCEIDSSPGSVLQVRSCATELLHYAKRYNVAIVLVGHITKSGDVAGPKSLEHLVDVVLYFEGDSGSDHRWLRSQKNRFGMNEVGLFRLAQDGLHSISNPSGLFVSSNSHHSDGVAWALTTEQFGSTRSVAAEIQSLVDEVDHPNMSPRHRCTGVSSDRVQMLLAVLSKRAKMKNLIRGRHTFVNVVGGLQLVEPGADLGIAMSLASSFMGQKLIPGCAFVGEVGLGGEIRTVGNLEARLALAQTLGINKVFVPKLARSNQVPLEKTVVHQVGNINDVLEVCFSEEDVSRI